MADIFRELRINQLIIPNRLIRSATWEGLAEADGTPTIDLANLTAELAEGGVGLIIAGVSFVNPQGRALPRQTGAHIDAMVGPLTRISHAVYHCRGLLGMQISHAGGMARPELSGHNPVGPSAIEHPLTGLKVEELTINGIGRILDDFAMAAARVKAAEFDMVQIQACHGYLISQFLSPLFNRRLDEYGGSLYNRARFCLEVYLAVRDAVGPDFPVTVKLQAEDGLAKGGLIVDDACEVAQLLYQEGVDAIEISGGLPLKDAKRPIRPVESSGDEAYFLSLAKEIKKGLGCPVFVVGGFRSRSVVEKALDEVDAVSLCRPLINDPDLPNRWLGGSREKSTCRSCNGCLELTGKQGLACVF